MAKFNLQSFTVKDPFRPLYAGVHHQDGYKVATDGHILCAVKEDYPEELENKTMRNGEEIIVTDPHASTRYPNWKVVIPDKWTSASYQTVRIDLAEFAAFKKEINELLKNNKIWKSRGCPVPAFVKIGDSMFKYHQFTKIASFMEAYKTNEIHISGSNAGYVEIGGNYAFVVPTFSIEESTYNTMEDGLYTNRVLCMTCQAA